MSRAYGLLNPSEASLAPPSIPVPVPESVASLPRVQPEQAPYYPQFVEKVAQEMESGPASSVTQVPQVNAVAANQPSQPTQGQPVPPPQVQPEVAPQVQPGTPQDELARRRENATEYRKMLEKELAATRELRRQLEGDVKSVPAAPPAPAAPAAPPASLHPPVIASSGATAVPEQAGPSEVRKNLKQAVDFQAQRLNTLRTDLSKMMTQAHSTLSAWGDDLTAPQPMRNASLAAGGSTMSSATIQGLVSSSQPLPSAGQAPASMVSGQVSSSQPLPIATPYPIAPAASTPSTSRESEGTLDALAARIRVARASEQQWRTEAEATLAEQVKEVSERATMVQRQTAELDARASGSSPMTKER